MADSMRRILCVGCVPQARTRSPMPTFPRASRLRRHTSNESVCRHPARQGVPAIRLQYGRIARTANASLSPQLAFHLCAFAFRRAFQAVE